MKFFYAEAEGLEPPTRVTEHRFSRPDDYQLSHTSEYILYNYIQLIPNHFLSLPVDRLLPSRSLICWSTFKNNLNIQPSSSGTGQTLRLTTHSWFPLTDISQICCGGRSRTSDLKVMSLASYHCSTPQF